MRKYYYDKSNYLTAKGTVTYMKYNDEHDALYLSFSDDLSPQFDDISFKIIGKNLPVVKENGIDQKVVVGSQISFITAPKYFGDGYIMPIVAITVDGEELLSFDEGYENLLEWLG